MLPNDIKLSPETLEKYKSTFDKMSPFLFPFGMRYISKFVLYMISEIRTDEGTTYASQLATQDLNVVFLVPKFSKEYIVVTTRISTKKRERFFAETLEDAFYVVDQFYKENKTEIDFDVMAAKMVTFVPPPGGELN